MICPICARETDAKNRPFCSRRCADVDLGKWLTGSYAIPAAAIDDENPEGDGQTSAITLSRVIIFFSFVLCSFLYYSIVFLVVNP